MIVKNLEDENFNHYKLPSMVIAFPKCTFKCGKELCQNSSLATSKDIEIDIDSIIDRYMSNFLTSAIVCAGLDPIDSFEELYEFIVRFRKISNEDIVIYTGYNESEIIEKIDLLKHFTNIIVKFGRYLPNDKSHFDVVLGVELASSNQYAKRIS